MKVALLTNFIAPYRLPLLQELARRVAGLRVFLSTAMEQDRTWQAEWGGLDVAVQRSVGLRGRYRDPLGFSRRLQVHVPYDTLPQLARFAPDVVISSELGMRSAQAALYCAAAHKPLLVWATLSEHSERHWGPARKALRRAILSCAAGVIVNGESGARYIAGFGVPDSRIFRVNQPVDVERFRLAAAARAPGTAWRMLHSGALHPRKGTVGFLRVLLAWAADHPDTAITMTWLGDGEDRPDLAAMAAPHNLAQHFLGEQPYEALPAFYAQADLLVFPSLMDEWGLVVNEAMACGVPVLGSIYSQAVEELVEEGVTGWTFDPAADGAARAALDRAFAVPRGALGTAAQRRVMTLTPASAADRIASAIRTVATASRAPVVLQKAGNS